MYSLFNRGYWIGWALGLAVAISVIILVNWSFVAADTRMPLWGSVVLGFVSGFVFPMVGSRVGSRIYNERRRKEYRMMFDREYNN